MAEAGIQVNTLQHYLARGAQSDSGDKNLYVPDESSLASTRQINEFLDRLGAEDRALRVGDVLQHEAIEGGGPYCQLQQAGMRTAHLDDIVHQKDPSLKAAVEQLARARNADAIIGMDLLQLNNLSIDFDTRKIIFHPVPQGASAVRGEPLSNCLILEVQVQGHPVRLIVDTGLPGMLFYEERLRKHVPALRTAGSVTRVTMGGQLQAKQAILPDVLLGKTIPRCSRIACAISSSRDAPRN